MIRLAFSSSAEVGATDLFRRNAFNLALAAKNLAASADALMKNAKVPPTAISDIELAVSLLEKIRVPGVANEFEVALAVVPDPEPEPEPVPEPDPMAGMTYLERAKKVVEDGLIRQAGLDYQRIEKVKAAMATAPVVTKPVRKVVRPPGSGKMLWLNHECPQCHAPVGKRCQSLGENPHELEKPHTPRKILISEQDNK